MNSAEYAAEASLQAKPKDKLLERLKQAKAQLRASDQHRQPLLKEAEGMDALADIIQRLYAELSHYQDDEAVKISWADPHMERVLKSLFSTGSGLLVKQVAARKMEQYWEKLTAKRQALQQRIDRAEQYHQVVQEALEITQQLLSLRKQKALAAKQRAAEKLRRAKERERLRAAKERARQKAAAAKAKSKRKPSRRKKK